jgi:endonuclease/exonuclease/phosphatase family metal-dependent hydrolase
MTYRTLLLILPFAIAIPLNVGCQMPSPVTVMSFNIRYGSADDGENRWELRKQLVLDTITQAEPEILALQEAEIDQVLWLDEQLEDYDYVGVGRDDGQQAGEMVPIFYNTRRLSLMNSGHFWLSDTPDEPGSVGWDAAITRMAQWAILSFNESPLNRVRVINTHFDHVGGQSRLEAAKLIRTVIDAQGGKPIILTGDFNCGPDSRAHQILLEDRGNLAEMSDPMLTVGAQDAEVGTYHAFGGKTDLSPRIDWILHNRRLRAISARVDQTHAGERYPSDHFAIVAKLELLPATRYGGM